MTDDETADDEMLDRLDAGLPAASPEEQAARAPYERLRARVRALPTAKAPPGMRDRVRAQWKAERAARRRRIIIGGVVAAAAVAAIALVLLWPSAARPGSHVAVAVLTPDGVVRRGTYAVGDVFQVRGREGKAHTEVRVYAKGKLIVRCPDDPRCDHLKLDLTLTVPGSYRVLWLSHHTALPAPHRDGYDGDWAEAQDLGIEVERSTVYHISP